MMRGLWVPDSADTSLAKGKVTPLRGRPVVDRCRVPTPDGPCGHPFYDGETERAKAEHIRSCVSRNDAVIREEHARKHPELLKPHDPEYVEWLRQHKAGIDAGTVRW